MRRTFLILGLLALVAVGGCGTKPTVPKSLILATTTSTQDSGLLDVLLPAFEKESAIHVQVVAVGSGQALELGRRGDADVLLTHSPAAEKRFMEESWGAKREPVMHNDFVLLGPAADPAAIKQVKEVTAALKLIAESKQPFVSRADESGTHQKELALWKEAAVAPDGDWYSKAGTGMANALRMAHEKQTYILADRATYLKLKSELELAILVEGDDRLLNRYTVITINPQKHPHLHHAEAASFAEFLLSKTGQELIGSYGKEQFGQSLFVPDAVIK